MTHPRARWLLAAALVAAGPLLAVEADQPEKARTNPLDTREPRQEVIEGAPPGPAVNDAPALDPMPADNGEVRPHDRRTGDAMPDALGKPAAQPPGS